jgi:uracil-DNA glycosylase
MEYLETTFMPKWPMFRSFNLERNWGIGISDIALINAVHCRTKNYATPSRRIAEQCFRDHTSQQIDILHPQLIICFGKKSYDFLNKLYNGPIASIKYFLHPSGQNTRQHPDKQMEIVDKMSQFLNVGRTVPKNKTIPKKRQFEKKSGCQTKPF